MNKKAKLMNIENEVDETKSIKFSYRQLSNSILSLGSKHDVSSNLISSLW